MPVEFDLGQFAKDNNAIVKGIDEATHKVQFETVDGKQKGEFDLGRMLSDNGVTDLKQVKISNSPDSAIDASPLSAGQRAELGLMTREFGAFQQLKNTLTGVSKEDSDKQLAVTQARGVNQLKKQFEDATISNGEYKVKKDGRWYNANANGLDWGDTAEFAAQNGLNILGGIAGGALAGPGGAIAGSALVAEGAEELLSAALAGDTIDLKGVAQDMTTDALMNLTGNAIGKGVAKGGSALLQAAEKPTAAIVKTFKDIAESAPATIKDGVASMYALANPNISQKALRAAIESPDAVEEVAKLSAIIGKDATGDVVNEVQNNMAVKLYSKLKFAEEASQEHFGKIVGSIQENIDKTDFKLDVGAMSSAIDNLYNQIPKSERYLFSDLKNITNNMKKLLPKEADNVLGSVGGTPEKVAQEISGAKAFTFLRQANEALSKTKTRSGIFKPLQAAPISQATSEAIHGIDNFIQTKIDVAAEAANLAPALDKVRSMYSTMRQSLKVLNQAGNDKSNIGLAQRIARGEASPELQQALKNLNEKVPGFNLSKLTKDLELRQAAVESHSIFVNPAKKGSEDVIKRLAGPALGIGAATAAFGPVGATITGAVAASPRLAYSLARNMVKPVNLAEKTAEGVASLARSIPYKEQARSLINQATGIGALQGIPLEMRRRILTDPQAFGEMIQKITGLAQQPVGSADKALNAATQAAQLKAQQNEQRK